MSFGRQGEEDLEKGIEITGIPEKSNGEMLSKKTRVNLKFHSKIFHETSKVLRIPIVSICKFTCLLEL